MFLTTSNTRGPSTHGNESTHKSRPSSPLPDFAPGRCPVEGPSRGSMYKHFNYSVPASGVLCPAFLVSMCTSSTHLVYCFLNSQETPLHHAWLPAIIQDHVFPSLPRRNVFYENTLTNMFYLLPDDHGNPTTRRHRAARGGRACPTRLRLRPGGETGGGLGNLSSVKGNLPASSNAAALITGSGRRWLCTPSYTIQPSACEPVSYDIAKSRCDDTTKPRSQFARSKSCDWSAPNRPQHQPTMRPQQKGVRLHRAVELSPNDPTTPHHANNTRHPHRLVVASHQPA